MANREVPSLWTGMDRKALAIGEFTLRQQRKRLSTWVAVSYTHLTLPTN